MSDPPDNSPLDSEKAALFAVLMSMAHLIFELREDVINAKAALIDLASGKREAAIEDIRQMFPPRETPKQFTTLIEYWMKLNGQ